MFYRLGILVEGRALNAYTLASGSLAPQKCEHFSSWLIPCGYKSINEL